MVEGIPVAALLTGFGLGWVLLLAPMLLCRYWPEKYRGFWVFLDELFSVSSSKHLALAAGWLLGLGLLLILQHYTSALQVVAANPIISCLAGLVAAVGVGAAIVNGLNRWREITRREH